MKIARVSIAVFFFPWIFYITFRNFTNRSMTIEKGFDDSLKIGEREKFVKNSDNEKVLKLIRIKNNRCPERGGERIYTPI